VVLVRLRQRQCDGHAQVRADARPVAGGDIAGAQRVAGGDMDMARSAFLKAEIVAERSIREEHTAEYLDGVKRE